MNSWNIRYLSGSKFFLRKMKTRIINVFTRHEKWLVPLSLFLICCIALLERLQGIGHELWLDELTTAWVVGDDFKSIFDRSLLN
ncbi:MAG: hypothetical protein ACHQFW_08750, partial [Chitinophagales bacterium]